MKVPDQTDRLEAGHVATFLLISSDHRPRVCSWQVVENGTSRPSIENVPIGTTEWLAPFIGQPVKTLGRVAAPESNEMVLLLIGISRTTTSAPFDARDAIPDWIGAVLALWNQSVGPGQQAIAA